MSMVQELREFAMRGNVIDMAVGIVIGGAFGQIVSSFVNQVLMPPLGLLLGGVHFGDLAFTLRAASVESEAVVLGYGAFIQTVVDFTIIAFAIFMVIRTMNRLKRKQEPAPEPAPEAPPVQEILLAEIRDLLKHRS